jgi:small subunit ribosomal protein S18
MVKKLKLKVNPKLLRKKARRSSFRKKKHCRFRGSAEAAAGIDYKNVNLLKGFVTERGKILPSRISGVCAYYQRRLSQEIKKARTMALLPYAGQHNR